MKIINCGRVIYLIYGNHIATIVYDFNNGQPSAAIYYDGQMGEIIEAINGQTLRLAVRLATWTIKRDTYTEQHHDEWIAILLKQTGIIYRRH